MSNILFSFLDSIPSIAITSAPDTICNGDNATFIAKAINEGSAPDFQWTKNGINIREYSNVYSDTALNNGDVINCILTPGNICVTITSVTSHSITVNVGDCIIGFHVPTAFTLNNDGINDTFRPLVSASVQQYHFAVYDRWWHAVFQSDEVGKGWDGKVEGVSQSPNIFIWTCTYQLSGEKVKSAKGTVMLLK